MYVSSPGLKEAYVLIGSNVMSDQVLHFLSIFLLTHTFPLLSSLNSYTLQYLDKLLLLPHHHHGKRRRN